MARSIGVIFAVLSLSAALAAPPAIAAQAGASGGTHGPLTLQVTCEGQGDAAQFHVQIANTSSQETAFVLGFTPPGSQTHVVDSSLDVFVIRPATGADEDYVYVNGKYATVTNGAPWIVSLPAGKAYDVTLPLKDFISRLNYSNLDVSVAAGARLVLDAQPAGTTATRVWTGKVETRIERCR